MPDTKELTIVESINQQINHELKDEKTVSALLATTFKGLDVLNMKKAIMEGMIRGFNFKNFLLKDVYAIPFAGGYSLVTSIDFARKIGARGGICGKDAPKFEMDGGKIISCTVTVKKMTNGMVGDFTATVYFDEYEKKPKEYNGKPGTPTLWQTKPRTMIAKVAEMHALRMACPEELSKIYVEEEFAKEAATKPTKISDMDAFEKAKAMIAVASIENLESAKNRISTSNIFSEEQKVQLIKLIDARLPEDKEPEAVVEPIGDEELAGIFDGE